MTSTIEIFSSDYRRSSRDIKALTYVVIVFLFLIIGRAALLIYECQYPELWELLPHLVPLLSVLVVVRVANRLLSNSNLIREDDRRQEIVRTTHHLIAISTDLKARVGYVKTMLTEGGGRPSIALVQIAKSIEDRYETLLQRDAYKYLPGPSVDIIMRISGAVFGIVVLAEGVQQVNSKNSGAAFMPIPINEDSSVPQKIDELMTDIQELIDQLYEVRHSIDVNPVES